MIAIRISSNVPSSITFTANLRGVRNQAHSNYGTDYFQMNGTEPGVLTLTGKSADYLGVEGKLRYEATARVVPEGGTMKQNGNILKVSNADAVTIYIVAASRSITNLKKGGKKAGSGGLQSTEAVAGEIMFLSYRFPSETING